MKKLTILMMGIAVLLIGSVVAQVAFPLGEDITATPQVEQDWVEAHWGATEYTNVECYFPEGVEDEGVYRCSFDFGNQSFDRELCLNFDKCIEGTTKERILEKEIREIIHAHYTHDTAPSVADDSSEPSGRSFSSGSVEIP